jgi:small neutral amino acid transporter SnatA (MarC family)
METWRQPAPFALDSFLGAFWPTFSALILIGWRIGSVAMFNQPTADYAHVDRQLLAAKVSAHAIILAVSLWLAFYILKFLGIRFEALRVGGGLVAPTCSPDRLSGHQGHHEQNVAETGLAWDLPENVASFLLTALPTTGTEPIVETTALLSQPATSALGALSVLGAMRVTAPCITTFVCYVCI